MTPRSDTLETHSPEQTRAAAARLGALLRGGEVIGLIGPLGAGKTQFVKGLAVGNGQVDATGVTSPTFTLVNEYPGRLHLYHLDAYRLASGAELLALGFEEMITPESAAVVEWADRVPDALPEDCLIIRFDTTGESRRSLTFEASGPSAERLLEGLCLPPAGGPPVTKPTSP